ncbi:MAG: hypothetical protein C0591_04190 [Marinilabiliales bacterium]|nr:MAG: hypothetical protein C0591_04190 [Marinilabiliales bacterium]
MNIHSGPNGPGNFKIFGDLTYRSNASSSIETYMENNAPVGAYYFHNVGPTVQNTVDYYGGGTGIKLQAFDLDILQTYAYQWQEPAGEWLNVYPYLYPIQTATGLLLSSTEGSGSVMSFTQTGEMLTGDVSVYVRHTNGNPNPSYEYLELISNPYPCAVSWQSLYNRNSGLVNPVIRIYNAEAQAWGDYNASTGESNHGVTDLIQLGQGIFVETNSAGHFTFTDEDKRFSSSPLRGDDGNMGSLKLSLNGNGMKDEMVIHFSQEATTGLDELYDTKDWGSYYEDATQIYSVVAGEMLSVNSLPFVYDEMMSVPVHIETKAPDSYTLSFNNLESFTNTDIWLEDSYSGGEMIKITPENSTYTFFSSPDLLADRFVVHFNASFLPNAIGEVEDKLINIYAVHNELYILNESTETIKEVAVFNILGQEISRAQVPEQSTYKFNLYEPAGYYIARVLTNKNVYSEKIFIK